MLHYKTFIAEFIHLVSRAGTKDKSVGPPQIFFNSLAASTGWIEKFRGHGFISLKMGKLLV